jgi:pimeloyl-ACP methyl ester carboxylesterase
MKSVEPFRIDVAPSDVDDLRDRLRRTRWPDEVEDAGWDYGTSLPYLRELVDYWAESFDWFDQQDRLNEWPQFRALVDGPPLHFVHVRGAGPGPLPIVLTHGWPSTFVELLELAARLSDPAARGADPADAFDVVVPSLPGYGFSAALPSRGPAGTASRWHELMTEVLGYERFAAHGGDIGAGVSSRLAFDFPESLIGIHVTATWDAYRGEGAEPPTAVEQAYLDGLEDWGEREGAYSAIQGTKPQTLGYGLNDSPAGLAAWIVEKWRSWGDTGGEVESRFSKDDLLTTISLYWHTQTITPSVRAYYESQHAPLRLGPDDRITVPTAVAQFPNECVPESHPPQSWVERTYTDLRSFKRLPRGGHFAAREEPDLVAEDIRAFFRQFRSPSVPAGNRAF